MHSVVKYSSEKGTSFLNPAFMSVTDNRESPTRGGYFAGTNGAHTMLVPRPTYVTQEQSSGTQAEW